jgi:tetratricopeptide (TPR) repeat protein
MDAEQFNKLVINPVLLDSETVDGLRKLAEKHPSFQLAWLLYLKNLKQIKAPEFNDVLKKVAVRISDRKLLYKFLNTNFHKKQIGLGFTETISKRYNLEGNTDAEHGNSLIDKFLQADPGKIRQINNENNSTERVHTKDVGENSALATDEIITETLANIYFQQKNYEKAQEAYKKLSLKYPEKSVYFATRIEEIEKLKNI